MARSDGAFALVESPAQLLHLLEWCHGRKTSDVKVAILAPRAKTGSAQLATVASLARQANLDVTWLEPRLSRVASAKTFLLLRRWLTGFDSVIVGDPFSGLIQSLLPWVTASHVTLLDDGTATIDFVTLLEERRPLFRWAEEPAGRGRWLRRPLASRATRFFLPRPGRTVELFTVMPVPAFPELTVTKHAYEWTRTHFGPPQASAGVTVIGSSLVESGILRTEAYLRAIGSITKAHPAPGQYIAHRNESERKLGSLAERTGLQIIRPKVPLEIALRRGPVGSRVVCFPSTPAYTLPYILRGTGVELQVLDIQASWLRPDAGRRATEFLESIGAQLNIPRQNEDTE